MSCSKGRIPFIFYLFYISLVFNFGYSTQITGLKCLNPQKKFLPTEQQNAAYTCPGVAICVGKKRKYYTIDGSCNNLLNPRWGQAVTGFTRIVAANYTDDKSKIRRMSNGEPLPNSRIISTTLFTDNNIYANEYNIIFYGFGQWIDHDMTLSVPQISSVQCCDGVKAKPNPPEGICAQVNPPENDHYYSKYGVTCVDVKRVFNTETLKCSLEPIEQINFQTSWLDLSLLYGPSPLVTAGLRSYRGGRLRTGPKQLNGQDFPPVIPVGCPVGGLEPIPGGSCLAAGDIRLLQNPELTVNSVTFSRLHNHIADGLSRINPTWNDNTLFNEARRILIAKYQHVVYKEVVPALIGPTLTAEYGLLPKTRGYAVGYNPKINGQTLASFASAAGRVLHSLIRGSASFQNPEGKQETYFLRDKYFNQNFLLQGNTFTNLIKSYVNTECSAQDQFFTTEVTDHLFLSETQVFGQDLISVDINRGRDFGMPPYNKFREACGLCPAKSFQDLEYILSNPENIPILQKFYKTVDDIDLYVLGVLEKPVPGGLVGPTMSCIIGETFYRLKFGDRLYYEFETADFTKPQLDDIRKTTFSQFLCLTNNITSIQPKSLLVPSSRNPEAPCSTFGDVNYNLFKEVY